MTESTETNPPENVDMNIDEDVNMETVKEGFINDDAKQGETTMDDSSNDASEPEAAVEEQPEANDPTAMEVTQDSPQPAAADAEEEELWDLRVILTKSQLLQNPPLICSTPGCSTKACSIWTSNLEPDNLWYTCLDCQALDFGGWPGKKDLPMKVMRGDHWGLILERCLVDRQNAAEPEILEESVSSEDASQEKHQESSPSSEDEEVWDCKLVMKAKELSRAKPTMCSSDDCDLVACVGWASNKEPGELWFGCLDCQAEFYDGFPEGGELPITYMSEETKKLILEKCTVDPENAVLPDLPTEPSLLVTAGEGKSMATITPPPVSNAAIAAGQSNVIVGAVKNGQKGKKSTTSAPDGAAKDKAAKPKQPSKEALAIHRKWQIEADKLGGGKIEVSKPKAKKLIFDMMHDSFRPMNITEIYQTLLKAKVPKPVLQSSLEEMADTFKGNPFADGSDDEDDNPPKKKAKKSDESADEYSGSMRLKEGRSAANNLYYVDYTKLQNNGNGLDPDKRNDLFADLEKAKCEEDALKKQLQETAAETTQLLSEPLNDELAAMLLEQEQEMEELNDKLETNRAFAGNEKYAKKLNTRVAKMASVWRNRRRQCMEFLQFMEESTEGTITLKKCLKGDGQICIDSDENIIKQAKAYAETKKNATVRKVGLKVRNSNTGGATAGLNPDPNFIGVTLTSSGIPQREYLNEN